MAAIGQFGLTDERTLRTLITRRLVSPPPPSQSLPTLEYARSESVSIVSTASPHDAAKNGKRIFSSPTTPFAEQAAAAATSGVNAQNSTIGNVDVAVFGNHLLQMVQRRDGNDNGDDDFGDFCRKPTPASYHFALWELELEDDIDNGCLVQS
jgi:hypothetical protein